MTLLYQESGFVFTMRKDDVTGDLPKGFLNVTLQRGKCLFSSLDLVSSRIAGAGPLLRDEVYTEKDECPDEGCVG